MDISEKNIKSGRQRLLREVKWCKSRILDELVDYKYAITDLRGALRSYKSAYSRYVKKPTERNREAMTITYRELSGEYAASQAVRERIISYLDTAAEATAEHRDLLGTNDRAGMLLADRFERYSGGVMSRLSALERGVIENIPDELTAPSAEPDEPTEDYAVSVARDIDELSRPLPEGEAHTAIREAEICKKLQDLLATAEKLVAELASISETYAELSRELEEMEDEAGTEYLTEEEAEPELSSDVK